jgi:hypothetical protein
MPLAAQDILQRATHAEHARFIFWLQDVCSVAIRFVLKKKSRVLGWLPAHTTNELKRSF